MRAPRRFGLTARSLILAVALVLVGATAAAGSGHAVKILSFDESQFQLPEGIAVDKTGNLFVSIAPLGQLWKFAPGSDVPEVFGQITGFDPASDFGLLGLAVNARGDVYAGVQAANPAVNGVWVFDRKTGAAERIPGTEQIPIANDVAFDKRGNLYITDTLFGNIWRAPRGGVAEPWLVDDPLLDGTGDLGLGIPVGANGIEYHNGKLYVAVSEQFSVVTIEVKPNGDPGSTAVLATLPPGELFPGFPFPSIPDGLALDVHGNVYVAAISVSSILKVTPSGDVSTVAAGDPLDWPSSIAFGTGKGDRKTLFAVNFSIGEGNGDPVVRSGPGVVAIDVGVPGLPLP